MKPIYLHDCTVCRFLGDFLHNELYYDLYVCRDSIGILCLARYGDDGCEYLSMTRTKEEWEKELIRNISPEHSTSVLRAAYRKLKENNEI